MGLLRFAHRFLVRQTMPRLAVGYYDALITSVSDFYLRPFCEEILAAFPASTDILDVGTGPGHLPVLLALANPGYRVVGIDLSHTSLCAGRRRAEEAGVPDRVEFRRADILRPDAGLPRFDLAVSTCSLHHWRHPARMLRAMADLLRPGGEIWLLDDFAGASEEERRKWIGRVEAAAEPGWLFRTVFRFESRHLAYARPELEALCREGGLELAGFQCRDVFFQARIRPAQPPENLAS